MLAARLLREYPSLTPKQLQGLEKMPAVLSAFRANWDFRNSEIFHIVWGSIVGPYAQQLDNEYLSLTPQLFRLTTETLALIKKLNSAYNPRFSSQSNQVQPDAKQTPKDLPEETYESQETYQPSVRPNTAIRPQVRELIENYYAYIEWLFDMALTEEVKEIIAKSIVSMSESNLAQNRETLQILSRNVHEFLNYSEERREWVHSGFLPICINDYRRFSDPMFKAILRLYNETRN